ncbi:MAG TPA: hypothetical protein H9896_00695 [Candidatus Pygmaiobacter gallistercoris]|nr:hypothetical protein [Candidatus Pygmaiobacter gallistercoris]
MTEGCVVARHSCRSGVKELEYFLLGTPRLERTSYSVMVFARQEEKTRFARVEDITCDAARAKRYFEKLCGAQVRPENLGEVLYELITV